MTNDFCVTDKYTALKYKYTWIMEEKLETHLPSLKKIGVIRKRY